MSSIFVAFNLSILTVPYTELYQESYQESFLVHLFLELNLVPKAAFSFHVNITSFLKLPVF